MDSEDFSESLIIIKATQNDSEEMLDFLNSDFLYNEPLTTSLESKAEDMDPLFKDLIKLSLQEPCFTYLVRSKASNEIGAIRMTSVLTKPSSENGNHSEESSEEYPSWKANAVAKLLGQLEDKAWILYPEVKKFASWVILSVHEKFGRQGIGRKLIEYRTDEIKEAGCEGIITEATAFKSQQLFAKLGYQNVYEILHENYKENDKQIFKCLDSTDRAVLFYKPL
uniref:N-acetyltransferase domain-containing protein n=1 Tax=Panagrolaimus sp. ES5 TaxID=591445 RepID=A0AC34F800_9BILA